MLIPLLRFHKKSCSDVTGTMINTNADHTDQTLCMMVCSLHFDTYIITLFTVLQRIATY